MALLNSLTVRGIHNVCTHRRGSYKKHTRKGRLRDYCCINQQGVHTRGGGQKIPRLCAHTLWLPLIRLGGGAAYAVAINEVSRRAARLKLELISQKSCAVAVAAVVRC